MPKAIHENSTEFPIPDRTPELPDQAGAGNVDRIRDILFGTQIKTYETRFARMEETLARETSELKDNTRKRFETLEAYFRKEAEALSARLKEEREERAENFRVLSGQLRDTSESLIRKLTNLEDKTANADSGLRAELQEESRKLLDEIRARHFDLSAIFEKRMGELRHEKTDRSTMAALLTEMAIRLSDEDQVKPGE